MVLVELQVFVVLPVLQVQQVLVRLVFKVLAELQRQAQKSSHS
jgi:hypothetical protein